MGSDPGGAGLDARAGWLASPYLWLGLAALFLGLALGEACRWALAARRGDNPDAARRSALAIACLALALGAGAGLLVLPPKASLSEALLFPWAAFLALVGACIGLWPRVGLLVAAFIVFVSVGLLFDARRGWVSMSGPVTVGRLYPFARADGRWRCELILYEHDSVPTAQALELASDNAALVVERLDFSGPAKLLSPSAYYRVVGVADASGNFVIRFPARKSLVERLEPLPLASTKSGPRGLLVRHSRLSSAALPLVALDPVYYGFRTRLGLGLGFEASGGYVSSDSTSP